MANNRYLTDRSLKALTPAAKGKRYAIWDTKIPAFGVLVGDKADDPSRPGKASRITFILFVRRPGAPNPARHVLGRYGAISLEAAREMAGKWRAQLDRGIDPVATEAAQREREAREAALKRDRTFGVVAEAFIAEKLPGERKGDEVERNIRSEFMPVWKDRPVAEITDLDVLAVINRKKRKAPAQARNLLGTAKRLFNWAIDQRVYGLSASPCDRLKPKAIIGEKIPRQRRLSDDELFAFWRGTARLAEPFRSAYRVLALTGLRLNEVADASWSELKDGVLVIPASRMKGRESKARDHMVPLPQAALDVIEKVTWHDGGKFIFSTTLGKKPVHMSSKVKAELDKRMLRTLRALARIRGNDPRSVEFEPWVNHDLRRTVRSNLSALKVDQRVAEAILGHVPPGIVGVYDVHSYLDEKADALELWSRRLNLIVSGGQIGNVVPFRRAAIPSIKQSA